MIARVVTVLLRNRIPSMNFSRKVLKNFGTIVNDSARATEKSPKLKEVLTHSKRGLTMTDVFTSARYIPHHSPPSDLRLTAHNPQKASASARLSSNSSRTAVVQSD